MTKRAPISAQTKRVLLNLPKTRWDIISTGGTKVALDNAGVDTIAIDDVTGFRWTVRRLFIQISTVCSLVVTSIVTQRLLRTIISS